jgi:beta-galactosidase
MRAQNFPILRRLLLCGAVLAFALGTGPSAATAEPSSNRYPAFLFGVCYYPEHWPESYWEEDARRMEECGVNTVRLGEFGWAVMEPREGQYDFSLFDRALATLGRHGIKAIFGTPTATPPKWLTQTYPEVLHVFETGQPADDQSRRHYCYNSPVYRRFSKQIVEELARHYRSNTNIIGWQIDNEMNNENRECFSPACQDAFRAWLRNKYGTLDALNARWGTVVWSQLYSDWDQIKLPRRTPAYHNPGLMLDFRRFNSDSATAFLNDQVEILRRVRPGDFITHNGVFPFINYYDFSQGLDLYAQDNYPTFKSSPRFPVAEALTLARSFHGRMMIMEQLTGPAGQTYMLRSPRPGETRLWAIQAIAHGAEGLLHFRWRSARRGAEQYWSGVLDADNVPRARFEDFKREGRELRVLGPQILGARVDSHIAVIKDFEADWVFEHQFLTREANAELAQNCLFQAASEQRYDLDFVSPAADLGPYQLVFASQLVLMDDALVHKLQRFVEGGGTLVMSAHSALKNRDNAFTDQTIPIGLTNLFGLSLDSYQTYQPPSQNQNSIRLNDGSAVPVQVFAEVLCPAGATVVGRWSRDFLKDAPAMTEHPVGRGKAVYFGSLFNLDSARALVRRYAREAGLEPIIASAPEQVEVTRRVRDATEFCFFLNHGEAAVQLNVGSGFADALTSAPAPEQLSLEPFGYRVLRREQHDERSSTQARKSD